MNLLIWLFALMPTKVWKMQLRRFSLKQNRGSALGTSCSILSKKFHGEGFGYIWPAAMAYRYEVFEYHMGKVLQACRKVADYLQRRHNLMWIRSSFDTNIKCDYINNNLAESFNSWVRDIKDLPLDELADKIREMVMGLFEKGRRIGERLQRRILPAIIHQLHTKSRGLGHLKVQASANWSAQVRDLSNNNLRHVVKIISHECTCLEW